MEFPEAAQVHQKGRFLKILNFFEEYWQLCKLMLLLYVCS